MGLVLAIPGGTAEIVESDGAHVVLHSEVPSPPGSTLTGTATDLARPFRVKVRGCRLLAEGGSRPFRIEGRFVDVTKDQRALVSAALRPPSG